LDSLYTCGQKEEVVLDKDECSPILTPLHECSPILTLLHECSPILTLLPLT